jgi:hypothetical protein
LATDVETTGRKFVIVRSEVMKAALKTAGFKKSGEVFGKASAAFHGRSLNPHPPACGHPHDHRTDRFYHVRQP